MSEKMKIKTSSMNSLMLASRTTWGNVKPSTKAFKSKRDYNRRDKSWKHDI
jgi:hypothetical protein